MSLLLGELNPDPLSSFQSPLKLNLTRKTETSSSYSNFPIRNSRLATSQLRVRESSKLSRARRPAPRCNYYLGGCLLRALFYQSRLK